MEVIINERQISCAAMPTKLTKGKASLPNVEDVITSAAYSNLRKVIEVVYKR